MSYRFNRDASPYTSILVLFDLLEDLGIEVEIKTDSVVNFIKRHARRK